MRPAPGRGLPRPGAAPAGRARRSARRLRELPEEAVALEQVELVLHRQQRRVGPEDGRPLAEGVLAPGCGGVPQHPAAEPGRCGGGRPRQRRHPSPAPDSSGRSPSSPAGREPAQLPARPRPACRRATRPTRRSSGRKAAGHGRGSAGSGSASARSPAGSCPRAKGLSSGTSREFLSVSAKPSRSSSTPLRPCQVTTGRTTSGRRRPLVRPSTASGQTACRSPARTRTR